jgi:hypothetical protein
MSSSGMWHRACHVKTDVSEQLRLHLKCGLLVTANVPSTQNLSILRMERTRSSETSAITRLTLLHIPEDGILQISVRPKYLLNSTLHSSSYPRR